MHPQALESLSESIIVIQNRSTLITISMVNYVCLVYNGLRWFTLNITADIVGNRVGQYAPTRKRPVHKKRKKLDNGTKNTSNWTSTWFESKMVLVMIRRNE